MSKENPYKYSHSIYLSILLLEILSKMPKNIKCNTVFIINKKTIFWKIVYHPPKYFSHPVYRFLETYRMSHMFAV